MMLVKLAPTIDQFKPAVLSYLVANGDFGVP